jgi:lysophospholipase L1-like esterase
MVRFFTERVLILAVLAAPVFGGNDKNYTYLALGDSIAFGYDPTVVNPAPDKYIGYPERVAEVDHLLQSKKEVNAACPGETSGSFLVLGAPDNHCQDFKAAFGLHTYYPGSQLSFATTELASNKHINLVTLSIGGNDLLLLQQACTSSTGQLDTGCVTAGLPAVLATYGQHLFEILAAIRASYKGTLVVMTSYVPTANSLFQTAVGALDGVMVGVAAPFGVKFADGYTAFQHASGPFGGDPCAAGLLIQLPASMGGGCDVHPSPLGRNILAGTVLAVQ